MTQINSVDLLAEQIKRHEGLELKPYTDTVGKTTIGVGRNLDDVGITEREAEFLLMNDIGRAHDEAKKFDWYDGLDMARKCVVINMIFNMGLPRFSKFEKTIAHIAAGDYTKAADEMLDSRWAEQVGNRANELSKQMATGEWQGV